jgi:hypothetical protein
MEGKDLRRFPLEQMEQMDRFLERLIEAGTSDIGRQVKGVARDYAEEIVDMLVEAKIELVEARQVVEARQGKVKEESQEGVNGSGEH